MLEQRTPTCLPIQDKYVLISDEWTPKSSCPRGQVEFTG